MTSPHFEFEKKRDFGSTIGDSLYFFTRNFRSFLLGFLLYIGPFFLVGALAMVYTGSKVQSMINNGIPGPEMFAGILVFIPFVIASSLMMISFVCAMVQKHQQQTDHPLIEGIWPYIRKNFAATGLAFLTLFLMVALPYGLILFVAFSLGADAAIAIFIVLSLPVLFYLIVPLTIFMVLHVLERNSIGVSLRRAFFLVRDHWWITFGTYLVISILASIASYIFMIPAYIIFIIQTLGSIGTGEVSTEFGMWFGILYACAFLGSLFAGMYQIFGVILQYYSLREQKEGKGLLRRIQEIDKPMNEGDVQLV